jgi:pimeloyl-ACP methyl ester carboxylesterase
LERFGTWKLLSYATRVGTSTAPPFYRDNSRERPWALVEKESDMSRVSKLSRTSATLVAAAATLAAMTTYNIYRARKVEREHPPTGRFITVNGIRLHYIERGEGPPVVLLHGNMVTAEDFDTSGVLDLVATQHRVIAFDRPGFGYSDRPHGSPWGAGAQADLLRDALVVLRIKRPIVLGHSWGAAVALALALNHPDAVGGLVLLSGYYYPSLRADVLLSSPAAIPILGDLLRYSISPLLGRLLQPLVLKGMFAPLPVPANFTKGSAPKMSVRPGQIRAESQDGVAMIPSAIALRHRYQELTLPVVIMAGTKDRVVNSKQPSRLHAQIPHSILRLIPDVGHMLHYAVPGEVAEAIEEAGGEEAAGLATKLHNIRQASASYTASAA